MHLLIRLFYITFFLVLTLNLLVACGNKGPLYLPEGEAPTISMEPTTPPAAVTTGTEE
ncbi:LPS translocon maturation chaperone LptM [Nitrosomonas aestuarii]|uniref:Lipoprotein-attachment site-containing protein n=1 Tax=Nitrosomonas aestuarii TaxID=52441 RepID=A0A1I4CTU3_9PROT|nr:lipoprotein [Nitrosomonas aestuarii]PTN11769.1 putative lipoprotein [Nitrosomonas aestuarii]SFK84718.1 lipoprotein-attachment site-containing protein [Nitrosomonas aestuarii]